MKTDFKPTHPNSRNKMAAISQTVNEKFCILIKISLKFVTKGPIANNPALVFNGVGPNRQQAIISTHADPINWRIYAAIGGNELKQRFMLNVTSYLWSSFNACLAKMPLELWPGWVYGCHFFVLV